MTAEAHRPRAISVDQALQMAMAEQRAGNLLAAQRLYEQITAKLPHQAQALTMLGSIAYQRGDDALGEAYVEQAIRSMEAALAAMPSDAPEQASLANLLLARNRPADAIKRLAMIKLPLNPLRSSPDEFHAKRRHAVAAGRPSILMTAMPKSASESLSNILAEGLGLAQSHVSIGLFPHCCLVPSRVQDLATGGVIAKEHIRPERHNLDMLAGAGIDKVLVHLRDPRQALLSWAHFVRDDVSQRMLAPIWRKILPPARILERDFAYVIDWCIECYLPLLIDFAQGWHKIEQSHHSACQVRCLSFEMFVADRHQYLAAALGFYGVDLGSMQESRGGLLAEQKAVQTNPTTTMAWLARHPRFVFHFTPTSCSWLNAVESFFAKLTKRRLKRGVFHSIIDLQAAIKRFLDEHNDDPKPFVWTADPDRIIAAVNRGHQALELIH